MLSHDVLTRAEAARQYGVSLPTIDRLRRLGLLEAISLGRTRRILFRRGALEGLLKPRGTAEEGARAAEHVAQR
jgi:excisionase family DNA binding protein